MSGNFLYLYISQWAHMGGQPGLGLYTFDKQTGAIAFVKQLDDTLSLGCSMVVPEKKVLYVCNECDLFPETPFNTGRVYCFGIDPSTGGLTLKNRKETFCPFTSYLNTDPEGKYLMVSNHSMHNFTTTVSRDENGVIQPQLHHHDSLVNLFALNPDGSIGDMVDYANHRDDNQLHWSLLGRPAIPHPHCIMRSPSDKLYACCDKGDSHLYLYTIEEGRLKLLSRTLTHVEGSEPRYCAFHPTLPYLYVNHEHTPDDAITLTTFRYTEEGQLTKVDTFYANTHGHQPKEPHRQQQGMCISPDGKTVYTQAHGYDLLLALAVDPQTGLLKQIQALPIDGIWPRSVNLSPDGRFLICCCLSGQILVYRVEADGTLTDTGHRAFSKGAGFASFFDPHCL